MTELMCFARYKRKRLCGGDNTKCKSNANHGGRAMRDAKYTSAIRKERVRAKSCFKIPCCAVGAWRCGRSKCKMGLP